MRDTDLRWQPDEWLTAGYGNRQAERILEAALEMFHTFGYSRTTIEMIRATADLSVGTIYHHFGSKEGIAGAVYMQSLSLFRRKLLRSIREANWASEAVVKDTVTNHFEWVHENPARATILAQHWGSEIDRHRERIEVENRSVFTAIGSWYHPAAERGEIRQLELPVLYAIWLGPAQEYTRLAVKRSDLIAEIMEAAPQFADAAWAALEPAGAS